MASKACGDGDLVLESNLMTSAPYCPHILRIAPSAHGRALGYCTSLSGRCTCSINAFGNPISVEARSTAELVRYPTLVRSSPKRVEAKGGVARGAFTAWNAAPHFARESPQANPLSTSPEP